MSAHFVALWFSVSVSQSDAYFKNDEYHALINFLVRSIFSLKMEHIWKRINILYSSFQVDGFSQPSFQLNNLFELQVATLSITRFARK